LQLLVFDPKWASLSGLDIIKPEFFENRILHNICKWIHEYYKQFKSIPSALVLEEKTKDFINLNGLNAKEFFQYKDVIDTIFTFNEGEDLEYFKEKAIVFVRQAAWQQVLANGSETLKEGNYEDAINAFKKVLTLGTENDLGLDFEETTTEQFIDLLKEDYDKSSMLQTGIPGWDKALGGGFVKKNLHLIGAAPGGGKSKTMAYLTTQALKSFKKVIFITLELSETETQANINCAITGLNMYQMLDPENRMEFEQKLAMFKNTFHPQCIVKFYKPGAITADTIHNFIQKVIQKKEEQFHTKWKPDVIFVDYLDKLLPTQKVKGNMYEDVGGVATDLKNLGISFDCPVISGSQLGRYTWSIKGDQVVNMDAIAESAQKIHLAHSLTTLNANPAEKEQGKVRLYLAKSRSGIPGSVVWCNNDLGRCKIDETEPWDPNTMITTTTFTIKDTDTRK
jgi:replicative DNA helicase